MQPQYGQPVYVQQQLQPAAFSYQQGVYYQQPGMGQPIIVQSGYGQQQVLAETAMIVSDVPQGYPTGQMIMGMGMRNLPNNANGCQYPIRVKCPACQNEGMTLVETKSGSAVYGWAAITCWFCCPLFFIPFFIDSCKDKIHKCNFCQAEVGVYQKDMC